MKTFAIASAAVLLFAATASAGDVAVSAATLDEMGLASMQQLSDAEGTTIRGQGLFERWFAGAVVQLVDSSVRIGEKAANIGNVFNVNFIHDLDFGGFSF